MDLQLFGFYGRENAKKDNFKKTNENFVGCTVELQIKYL